LPRSNARLSLARGSGGLFRKLFAAFTLATLLSFALGIGFYELTRSDAAERHADSSGYVAIAQALQESGPEAARGLIARSADDVSLRTAAGDLLAGTADMPSDAASLTVISAQGERYRLSYQMADETRPSIWVPVLAGLFVSLVISAIVAFYLSQPIALLRTGFHDIGEGNFGIRLSDRMGTRVDEIADLALEFDGMADRLQRLVATQDRLLHDISHELRSPLARMDVAIGLARRSPEQIEGSLDRMQREVERLDKLIGEILTLARLNSGVAELNSMKLDVVDLLHAIVEDAEFEARARQCTIDCRLPTRFVVNADGELLYRAYENVIRNAVKFAPSGSVVAIKGNASANGLVVRVCDMGPGVPNEMLDAIFAPFCRVTDRDGDEPVGTGLGLAITRHAMERHGGSVSAEPGSVDGLGLCVTLYLPTCEEVCSDTPRRT